MIKINIQSNLNEDDSLRNLKKALNNSSNVNKFGQTIVGYIKENFIKQGRPDKWKQSEIARKENRLTAIKTGALMNSFYFQYNNQQYVITTDITYGPYINNSYPFMYIDENYLAQTYYDIVLGPIFGGNLK